MSIQITGRIIIHTDGSAKPNPGTGGWAVIIDAGPEEPLTLSGGKARSTNNEMELTAILHAMMWLRDNGSPPAVIHSDSRYAIGCISQWAAGWDRRGWRKAGGPIQNLELIKVMLALSRSLDLHWQWVKGHSGVRWNHLADTLAEAARKEAVP
ncbi:MAG: rnhA [Verrucomicrobiales bacterium]|nr:rnhA [Verrucomicrobiales bacterium]